MLLLHSRYLLYDVNLGEGFNLRRDVYMRVANLVRNLNKDAPWVLVLPPWGNLYHWKSRHLDQIGIPWSLFFDLPSLRRFVPVIEFEEFLKCMSSSSAVFVFPWFDLLCCVVVYLASIATRMMNWRTQILMVSQTSMTAMSIVLCCCFLTDF